MRSHAVRIVAVLALVLALALSSAAASERAAVAFIRGMLLGVKASVVDCPEGVAASVTARGLRSICATYDGDFESLRSAWDVWHEADFDVQLLDGSHRSVRGQARTAWETSGDEQERIYAVGDGTVGVRVSKGEILIVYK